MNERIPGSHTVQKLDEDFLRSYFHLSSDVKIQTFFAGEDAARKVLLLFNTGMSDTKELNQYVFPRLEELYHKSAFAGKREIDQDATMPLKEIEPDNQLEEITLSVYSGQLVLFFMDADLWYSLDISDIPSRNPEEPTSESSIRGPHDGFTESLDINSALIRKRLRTQSLCIEEFTLQGRAKTRIRLHYIQDIANEQIITEIRSRLHKINRDAILGTSNMENIIMNYPRSLFPMTDYSGRPDYVAIALLNGRFAVMYEGSPMAIIAPITLTNLLMSSEDANTPFHIASLERILRLVGFGISLFLPGFYIALSTFNLEQIPLPLLATIHNSRVGLPLPLQVETFIMLFLFEIFSEAGRRLPKAVGQTVTVVGGLIIGDSAIRAGFTSPTLIVVVAITTIATYTLVNQNVSGTVTIVRLFILAISSFLGIYGFMIAVVALVLHLSSLELYGVPYLAPISPFQKKDFLSAIVKKPLETNTTRPETLHPRDKTKGNT